MNYFKEYAGRLIANGYSVVPLKPRSKIPAIDKWNTAVLDEVTIKPFINYEYTEYGVGLLTKGLIVIDIDVYDEEYAALIASVCRSKGKTLERVGQHPKTAFFFRGNIDKRLTSESFKDSEGRLNRVEVLGSGAKDVQVAAFGIHPITQEEYQWIGRNPLELSMDQLTELTYEEVVEIIEYTNHLFAKHTKKSTISNKPPTYNTHSSLTLKEASNQLQQLDPNMSRLDGWLQVGMALHYEFGGSQEAFALWDEWSSSAPSYNREDLVRSWKGFQNTSNPVTWGSIKHMLKKKVHTDIAWSVYENETAYSHKLGISIPYLRGYLDNFVLQNDLTRIYDIRNPERVYEATRNAVSEINRGIVCYKGKEKYKVFDIWTQEPGRKMCEGSTYRPAQSIYFEEGGFWYVNSYVPPKHPLTNNNIEPFLRHIKYLCPIAAEAEWLLRWIAFCVQYPQERTFMTPLHISPAQGTGRGILKYIISQLVGEQNVKSTQYNRMTESFNDFLVDNVVCFVDEVLNNNRNAYENIKEFLTDKSVAVNVKYKAKKEYKISTKFFMMSNHGDAINLPEGDRRFYVISGAVKPQHPGYYKDLMAWASDPDNIASLYWYLMKNVNVKNFNEPPFVITAGKKRLIAANTNPTKDAFEVFLEVYQDFVMTRAQIRYYVKSFMSNPSVDYDDGVLTTCLSGSEYVAPIPPYRITRGDKHTTTRGFYDTRTYEKQPSNVRDHYTAVEKETEVL